MNLKTLGILLVVVITCIAGVVAADEDFKLEPCITTHSSTPDDSQPTNTVTCSKLWTYSVINGINLAIESQASRFARIDLNQYAQNRPNYGFDEFVGHAKPGKISWQRFSEKYDNYIVGAKIKFATNQATTDCGLVLEYLPRNKYYYLEFKSNDRVRLRERNINNDTWTTISPHVWQGGWRDTNETYATFVSNSSNEVTVIAFVVRNRLQLRLNGHTAVYYEIDSTRGTDLWAALATDASADRNNDASCRFEEAWLWEITDWTWRN